MSAKLEPSQVKSLIAVPCTLQVRKEIERMAVGEDRTVAAMGRILLKEAIRARQQDEIKR